MVNVSDTTGLHPLVDCNDAGLLLVDLQERLAPAIAESPAVVARCLRLLEAFKAAGRPVLATEQYSKGLGPTVAALRERLTPDEIIEKTAFGAPREAAFTAALDRHSGVTEWAGVTEWIVAGMEAHVCVLQTVLCLRARDAKVALVSDAVASRVPLNKELALRRMAAAGVALTDSDSVLIRLHRPAQPGGLGQAAGTA
ncbi:isochorismatase family protein [Pelagibius sp.]|uniref:isochorismatase family protein n=1 Tax=Pelagibius sp. TaxID=1931238 RepID=UPI003B501472